MDDHRTIRLRAIAELTDDAVVMVLVRSTAAPLILAESVRDLLVLHEGLYAAAERIEAQVVRLLGNDALARDLLGLPEGSAAENGQKSGDPDGVSV